MNYEINMECYNQAQITFEEIILLPLAEINSWSMLVRGAYMIGKIEKLYGFYKKLQLDYKELPMEEIYNKLFSQYCRYKEGNLSTDEIALILSGDFNYEIKSIEYYLLSLLTEYQFLRTQYLRLGYLQCKYNYSLIFLAFENDLILGSFSEIDYIKMNPEYLEKVKYSIKGGAKLNMEVCILGGGNNIGGSCYLIKFEDINILVDAGVSFGQFEELIPPNFNDLKKFGVSEIEDIDIFILTHAHLDHCGAISELYKKAPEIPMYATEETCELAYKILVSSIKRNEEYKLAKYYIEKAIGGINRLGFRRTITLDIKNKELKLEFFRAGHILGAAAIYIELNGKGIFFTGDYCLEDQRTIKGMDIPAGYDIDLLVTEATYGSAINHLAIPRKVQEQIFMRFVMEKLNSKKKVLIPAFGLGRSQEVISLMMEYFYDSNTLPFRTYVDGIVVDICKTYSRLTGIEFNRKGIFFAEENQGYKSKLEFIDNEVMQHSCCVIASSGMIKDGSVSSYYAQRFIEDEDSVCIITGYQDEDSVGHRLKSLINTQNNDQYIEINGEILKVKCEIAEYYLSAHCQIEDIIKLVLLIKPQSVCLIHGQAKEEEPSYLYKALSKLEGLNVVQSYNGKSHLF